MFNISPDEALADFSNIYFNKKKIIANVFDRAVFTFVADVQPDQSIHLSGFVRIQEKEYDIEKLDHIFPGPPPGFIVGSFLYFIGTPLLFEEISTLPKKIDKQQLKTLLKSDAEVIVLGDHHLKDEKILYMRDQYGITASINDSEFEQELLLTDYQKKLSSFDPYSCQSDKVFDSLKMLHHAGWQIKNSQGKTVIPLTHSSFETEWLNDKIEVKGTLEFDQVIVPLSQLTERDTLHLNDGKVGLLPKNFHLSTLGKKGIKTEKGFTLNKHQAGLLFTSLPFEQESLSETSLPLREYQLNGLKWLNFLYKKGFQGALLADDMGLGKTIQSLAFLSQFKNPKTLIVCPKTLLFNWKAEIKKFCPSMEACLHHGPERNHLESDTIITSYGTLKSDNAKFKDILWDMVILDEAHAIKNRDTQVFKAALSLKSKFRLSLTGTPIENRLEEIHSQFHFLMPELIEASDGPIETKKKIAPFILRRTKAQVLKDLPPKIEESIWIEMAPQQKAIYDDFLKQAKEGDILSKSKLEILEVILRLRQIALHPSLAGFSEKESAKIEALMTDLEVILSEKRQVIIFSQFTSLLQIIKKTLEEKNLEPLYLDGQTKNREEVVNKFQNKEGSIFLMSLKAGGVGLNLTNADYILIMDPWWNEAVENQAISRSHRIGRKDPVFVRRYIALDSIEENIQKLKESKVQLTETLLEEANFSVSDFASLLG